MSEFSDDMRQVSRDIVQFRTQQSTKRLQQLAEEQRIQSAHQTALLGDLLFEQQIAGFSEDEKQTARADRQLGLDPLMMRSLPWGEQERRRAERRHELAEDEARRVAYEAEQYRKAKARNTAIAIVVLGLIGLIARVIISENNKQEHAKTLQRVADQGREEAARSAAEAERREQTKAVARVEEAKAVRVEAAKVQLDAAQSRAVLLHLQRASNGYSGSQLEVGRRYLLGNGLPQDKALAVHWLKAAAAQGEKAAEEMLRNVAP